MMPDTIPMAAFRLPPHDGLIDRLRVDAATWRMALRESQLAMTLAPSQDALDRVYVARRMLQAAQSRLRYAEHAAGRR